MLTLEEFHYAKEMVEPLHNFIDDLKVCNRFNRLFNQNKILPSSAFKLDDDFIYLAVLLDISTILHKKGFSLDDKEYNFYFLTGFLFYGKDYEEYISGSIGNPHPEITLKYISCLINEQFKSNLRDIIEIYDKEICLIYDSLIQKVVENVCKKDIELAYLKEQYSKYLQN